jgi:hypothetical protein
MHADAAVKRRRSDSRKGIRLKAEEKAFVDELVTRLVRKGQPLTHIYAEHEAEMPISLRSLYNYIDAGELTIRNIDLRRKTGYKPRKKKNGKESAKDLGFADQRYREGRTYEDGSKSLLVDDIRNDLGDVSSSALVSNIYFGNCFNSFGGFDKISTQNEKCFTIYETSDTEEAKKIMDINHIIAEKCIEASNKLNDKVMHLGVLKRQFKDTLKDDYFYEEFMEHVTSTLSHIRTIYNTQKSIITVFETASYPVDTGSIVIK